MSFDHKGRVSTEWAAWDFSRRATQPADTLCEGRITRLAKSAVRGFAQSRAVAPFVRALSLVNWIAVLIPVSIFAAFMSGVMVATYVLLGKESCQ